MENQEVRNYSSRKYPYSPQRKDRNFLGEGDSVRPKYLKKCM